jgi:hypothetical protein
MRTLCILFQHQTAFQSGNQGAWAPSTGPMLPRAASHALAASGVPGEKVKQEP